MKIIGATLFDHEALKSRLRDTPLRGFDGHKIYTDDLISMYVEPYEGGAHMIGEERDDIGIAQRYALKQGIDDIIELREAFRHQFGFDLFRLNGFARIRTDANLAIVRDFLPPIVEWSDPDGCWVLNDGMHRIMAARETGDPINCMWIQGVHPDYPYYAVPRRGKEAWEIDVVAEAPPKGSEGGRKEYRHPENYRDYYRDFNVEFENVSMVR